MITINPVHLFPKMLSKQKLRSRLEVFSVSKLTEFLKAGDPERSIVVTHHAPSIRSIADRYKSDPVSAAFAANMDDFIIDHQPRLWIHGHTHESFDYEIGKTRVVCNPRGYAAIEENHCFRPDYTVVV